MHVLSSFAGGTIFGSRTGSEPTRLVALHGWRKDHTDLQKVVNGYDAISLDLAGFGRTPEPDELWGADDYARAVGPVLDEIGTPVVVFGHSFGGRVALCLAAQRPEQVKSLVLTGAPLLRRQTSATKVALSYKALRFAHRAGLVSDERMESEKKKRGSADYRAADGLMRDIFVKLVNESYEAQLAATKCHVEMVWGENDTEAPLSVAQEAASMLSDCRMTVVAGGSHWLTTEDPQSLRDAIDRCVAP